MPARNTVRNYAPDCIYHVYNRGVEKRKIFLDESDCRIFIFYLQLYLTSKEDLKVLKTPGLRLDKFLKNNLSEEVSLLAYALMPNHFHFLVKQSTSDGITKLMKRVTIAYVMYFNNKYARVGPLFQGLFKAALISTDEYLIHASRYIHQNSFNLQSDINFINFSSYSNYLNQKKSSWLHPEIVLSYFSNKQHSSNLLSYESFVEDTTQASNEILGSICLED